MRETAAELVQRAVGIFDVPERQRNQTQAGGPALDLMLQVGESVLGNRVLGRRTQHRGGFIRRETQILETDLDDLIAGAQSASAGGDRDA